VKLLCDTNQRRRHSPREIERIVAQYREGTHTQREIAERHGICVGTLRNWLERAAGNAPKEVERNWIEVIAEAPARSATYRIELPGARTLVLGAGWCRDEVRELVNLLCQP
jgi:transposase-like protein